MKTKNLGVLVVAAAILCQATAFAKEAGMTGSGPTVGRITGVGGVFFKSRDPAALAAWYRDLLHKVAEHAVRTGAWQLLEADGWPDNQSCRNLIACAWTHNRADADGVRGHVVVVNLSETPAEAQIPLPWPDLPGRDWHLADLLTGEAFTRNGAQLADPGLYVDLQPGRFYLLEVR